MTKPICKKCKKPFARNPASRRPQIYCGSKCRREVYDRVPDSTFGQKLKCARCGKDFVKKKNHQRFCSLKCYKGAWIIENRDVYNARMVKRRQDNPEWYAEREPLYYRAHRNKEIYERPWSYTLKSRKIHAKEKNIPFTLTHEWAAARWTGRCELTNIEFVKNPQGRGPYPFSCTIDRVEPKLGYVPDNCRFILWGCNGLKGSGTDADMYKIAEALTANISRKDSPLAPV